MIDNISKYFKIAFYFTKKNLSLVFINLGIIFVIGIINMIIFAIPSLIFFLLTNDLSSIEELPEIIQNFQFSFFAIILSAITGLVGGFLIATAQTGIMGSIKNILKNESQVELLNLVSGNIKKFFFRSLLVNLPFVVFGTLVNLLNQFFQLKIRLGGSVPDLPSPEIIVIFLLALFFIMLIGFFLFLYKQSANSILVFEDTSWSDSLGNGIKIFHSNFWRMSIFLLAFLIIAIAIGFILMIPVICVVIIPIIGIIIAFFILIFIGGFIALFMAIFQKTAFIIMVGDIKDELSLEELEETWVQSSNSVV